MMQMNSAVVFNTIHGALGEDGTLQQYLSYYDIPYTGSPEAPSRICMNKLETAECIGVRLMLSSCACNANASTWTYHWESSNRCMSPGQAQCHESVSFNAQANQVHIAKETRE